MPLSERKDISDYPQYYYEHTLDFLRTRWDDIYYLFNRRGSAEASNKKMVERIQKTWESVDPNIYYSPYYEAVYRAWHDPSGSTKVHGVAPFRYHDYVGRRVRPRVFMDISVGEERPRRVIIELRGDKAPMMTMNFLGLAEGFTSAQNYFSYNNTLFHRVDRGFALFAGDVFNRGGTKGLGFLAPTFKQDLNDLRHDRAGVLSMDPRGRNTVDSQFLITQRPLPELDGVFTPLGLVVEGLDVIHDIDALPLTDLGAPRTPVRIVRSGIYIEKEEDDPYVEFCKSIPHFGDRGVRLTPPPGQVGHGYVDFQDTLKNVREFQRREYVARYGKEPPTA
jgi:cyclophilin family peptidyl-prolyl cis-trans isomerase